MIDVEAFAAIPAEARFMLLTDGKRLAIRVVFAFHLCLAELFFIL
jgi:hypothetical protein